MPGSCIVTLDVGGTTIKGALVLDDGREVWQQTVPTPAEQGPDAVVACLRAVARDLASRADGTRVVAAGVCVPGIVDSVAGVARSAANLGWRDVPLRELLAGDLGVPVVVENDVRAATVAEVEIGRGRGVSDLMVIVLGTGVAAGLVVGGVPVTGAAGMAGEFGHLPVHPGGELCACGQRGCLEAYASAGAVARRYAAAHDGTASAGSVAAGSVAAGSAAGSAGGSGAAGPRTPALTAQQVVDRAATDPVAGQVWAQAVSSLGLALASCTLLLDPRLVVLAGGLTGAGAALLDPVRSATQAALAWRPAPEIEISPLGATAGRVGAAIIAWRAAGRGAMVTQWLNPP